ncbi:phospholipid/cholesterol/gamma-HCH transport system substrate-binding protein [Mucilaginibacter gracilis]|uniref:Phospholipid/cholesterol/gamma-HCH transport system substrate-binding protein n=1 Tax=Mucilaginibacter gracilis TaxID=423350 RepID=A0A495IXH0_9SPHI|nr:MlaD family protein [Mucilaginibacter gracilis]RKR81193.1 phospholipid/cholesterol/gamma-HCH transport system substrate-binding protein [Mucilaginibacter gracilis]
MKTTTGQKLKIGIFTAIGILILFAAVFLIGSQKNLFSSTYRVHGIFKNVGGLQVGNNVRLAGINVGVVESIEILTDTSVRVDLTINTNFQKFVKKDARLSIGTDGFIGDKLVTIAPGGATTTEAANAEQELRTIPPFDTDKLVAKATKIVDNLGILSGDMSEIVGKINSGKGSIGRLLNNDKMAKDMEHTVNEAKNTMTSVKRTTGTLNEDLKAAQSNFLLKGFFKKKQKAEQAKKDSINKARGIVDTTAKKKRKGFLGLGGKG